MYFILFLFFNFIETFPFRLILPCGGGVAAGRFLPCSPYSLIYMSVVFPALKSGFAPAPDARLPALRAWRRAAFHTVIHLVCNVLKPSALQKLTFCAPKDGLLQGES